MGLLVSWCSPRIALILNEGLFFSKYVTIMVFIFIALRIDSSFFSLFGDISAIFSYFFLIIQAIILIDLAYLWGISWAKRYSDGSRSYACWLVTCTVIFAGALTVFLIMSFFNSSPGWVNIVGILEIIIMIGVQLLNFNKQNSLLTTSLLGMMMAYEIWSSGHIHPNSHPESEFIYVDISINFILVWICTFGSIYGSTNVEKEQMIDLDRVN